VIEGDHVRANVTPRAWATYEKLITTFTWMIWPSAT
jgi:hypothetical protein